MVSIKLIQSGDMQQEIDNFGKLKHTQIAMLDAQKYALQLELQLHEAQKKLDCCKCGSPAAVDSERDEYSQPIG